MKELLRILRGIIIILLLVAIIGPWAFDSINVPAQYNCDPPFIRLEGDFCGIPMSGMYMLFGVASEIPFQVVRLFTGSVQPADMGRQLLGYLCVTLLVLPLFTTLRLIVGGDRRSRQTAAIAAWVLAAAVSGVYWIFTQPVRHWALWGSILYTALASCALVIESALFMVGVAKQPLERNLPYQ